MIFDILGDTIRSGPQLWHVKRERLEDVKNHILDLILMARILRKYLPAFLDFDKIYDYIICHDLPEAITGDITRFEGVSDEEIDRVTRIAIDYLSDKFGETMDLRRILNDYENRADIESKVVNMLDKISSFFAFLKYQSESYIDMDDERIIPLLREHPFVVAKKKEGKDLGDIFYEFHMMAVNISEEECQKYSLSKEMRDIIVEAIRALAQELYRQKLAGDLLGGNKDFPEEALKYNRKYS